MTTASNPTIDLSIVIPAYREADMISRSLQTLAVWLDNHDYGSVEVIVVAADADDGTNVLAQAEAHRFEHFRLIEPGARVGKGRDVRAGMLAARGRYRVFMDADIATPLHHLDDVKRMVEADQPVGIAVRNLVAIHPDLKRKWISSLGNLLAQVILLPGIKDTQCGFKVFRDDAAVSVFERLTILGWGFDLEVLAIARSLGYHITTFNAPDWSDPKELAAGLSNDSATGAAIQTLKDLFRVRLNLVQGRYR